MLMIYLKRIIFFINILRIKGKNILKCYKLLKTIKKFVYQTSRLVSKKSYKLIKMYYQT